MVAKFKWPEAGPMMLDRIQIMEKSFYLQLLQANGSHAGEVYLILDKDAEDKSIAREVVNFSVRENFRGLGLGSVLMRHAVRLAHELEMKTLRIGLGNERTLQAFRANFDEDQLTFYRRPLASPHLVRLPAGAEKIAGILEDMRAEQFPDDLESTEQLRAVPRRLYAVAELA